MTKKKLIKTNIKRAAKYNTKKLIEALDLFTQNVGLTRNAKLQLIDEFITTTTRYTKLGYKKEFIEIDNQRNVRAKDNTTLRDVKRIKKINKELRKIIQDKPDKLTNYQLLKKQGYTRDEINEKLFLMTGKIYNLSYKAINKLSKKSLIALISAKAQDDYEDFYLSNRDIIIEYNKAIGEERKMLAKQLKDKWNEFNVGKATKEWIKALKKYGR
ncbi:MAG: hypothetical protein E7Y34_02575 [Mycoplasma sp.]|nr:hypothetical protein [Mycoplasma sp.]